MPQKKGWLTVQVREEVKNNLLELYNKDKKGLPIKNSQLIWI